jgi:hypothetical protein
VPLSRSPSLISSMARSVLRNRILWLRFTAMDNHTELTIIS